MFIITNLTFFAFFALLQLRGEVQPNLVFIMTDDQSYDAVSGGQRYPFFQMPNLDRLREEGTEFTNAFVTTSVCSPSRATCLTGLYAHKTGVPTNNPHVDPSDDIVLVSEMLQEAGYETAFFGKWHQADTDKPRRGFDHWVGFRGQGVYFDPVLNVDGKHVQHEGYTTDILTEYAIQWLKERDKKKPFCLFLWHKAPHGPFTPPKRYENLYDGDDIAEPPNFRDSYKDKPEWQRRGVLHGVHADAWKASEAWSIPDDVPMQREWDEAMKAKYRDYLESLQAVDDSLGAITGYLKATDQLNDTFILYTSDNGYNADIHQSPIDKRNMWEESISIPLIVRAPKNVVEWPRERVDEMVLNVDFVPTFLDLAGVSRPNYLDGNSFVSLLKKPDSNWRNAFFYVYFQESYAPGIVTMYGVRDDRYKLVIYPEESGIGELYDLKRDPYEMDNLYEDPTYSTILDRMRSKLRNEADAVDFDLDANPSHYLP